MLQSMRKAPSDIDYVRSLTGRAHEMVVQAYVEGFSISYASCIGLTGMCFIFAIVLRDKRIE